MFNKLIQRLIIGLALFLTFCIEAQESRLQTIVIIEHKNNNDSTITYSICDNHNLSCKNIDIESQKDLIQDLKNLLNDLQTIIPSHKKTEITELEKLLENSIQNIPTILEKLAQMLHVMPDNNYQYDPLYYLSNYNACLYDHYYKLKKIKPLLTAQAVTKIERHIKEGLSYSRHPAIIQELTNLNKVLFVQEKLNQETAPFAVLSYLLLFKFQAIVNEFFTKEESQKCTSLIEIEQLFFKKTLSECNNVIENAHLSIRKHIPFWSTLFKDIYNFEESIKISPEEEEYRKHEFILKSQDDPSIPLVHFENVLVLLAEQTKSHKHE